MKEGNEKCSFCGVNRFKCRVLIKASPRVYICEKCVVTCVDILANNTLVAGFKKEVSNGD